MLQEVKAQALNEVGPYGLSATSDGAPYGAAANGVDFGPGPVVVHGAPVSLAAGAAVPAAAVAGTVSDASAASAPTSSSADYSTTNDQEQGVDEPDMVKTNGQLMVVLRQQPQGLQVVDVSGSTPVLDGFLALPQFAELDGMFLVGQDAVVIGSLVSPSQPVAYAPSTSRIGLGGPLVPGTGEVNPGGPMVPAAGQVNPGGPMVPAPDVPASTATRSVLLPAGGGA
jgi:hypothetical protein